MVASSASIVPTQTFDELEKPPELTLHEFLLHPPDHMEWVDGVLEAKKPVSLQHSEIILSLGAQWRGYAIAQQQGGKVYVDVPCKTQKQGRRSDVAYITQGLLDQFGNVAVVSVYFP